MQDSEEEHVISRETMMIFALVVYAVVGQIINIFGIVTNNINIICFVKQGFKDSVNITLLGLSVSDLGSLIAAAWSCMSLTPAFYTSDLPFDAHEVAFLASAMTHLSFTRVSSCITAMITLERCLCITVPLKIKQIVTPKRTAVITVGIFIIFFCSGSPVYAVNKLGMKFNPMRNKSLVGLVSTEDRENVEMISFAINNFCIPLCAFVIILVCTIVLSYELWNKTRWRKKTSTSNQLDKLSTRNQKTAKMVVMISTLFILCFVPVTIIILAMAFLPELSVTGKYINITLMMAGLGLILQSINSSMNIFIYYQMSSKYRDTYCNVFKILREDGSHRDITRSINM